MALDHEHFMRLALEEARLGEAEGNIPVGCVVVREGKVIARGHNLVTSTRDVTAHAETVALRNAQLPPGAADLSGATLYTTFSPCPMCIGAILVARITTLVLGGRSSPYSRGYGDYSVERMLELARWRSNLTLVPGVLQEEGEKIFNEWQRRRQG